MNKDMVKVDEINGYPIYKVNNLSYSCPGLKIHGIKTMDGVRKIITQKLEQVFATAA